MVRGKAGAGRVKPLFIPCPRVRWMVGMRFLFYIGSDVADDVRLFGLTIRLRAEHYRHCCVTLERAVIARIRRNRKWKL